jgi:hypothetical protein
MKYFNVWKLRRRQKNCGVSVIDVTKEDEEEHE